MLGGGRDLVELLGLLGRRFGPLQQVGEADDGVHRRADLVAHVGQKGALGPVGGLGGVLGGDQLGGAVFDQFLQVVAMLVQLGGNPLAFGDVAADAQHADEPPLGVEHRGLDGFQQLPVAVVGEGHLFFVDRGLVGGDGRAILRAEKVGQLPIHEIVIGLAQDLRLPGPVKPLETGVAGQEDALRVLQPDQVGHGLHQRFEETALPLQRRFRPLAVGDIGVGDDDPAVVRFQGRHRHVEPARLARRMAGIFEGKARQPALQHRLNAIVGGHRAFRRLAAGLPADRQVVDAEFGAPRRRAGFGAVFQREAPPGFVDGHDHAVAVQHGEVGGHGIQDVAREGLAIP